MTQIRCRTSLDLRNEQWPTELGGIPAVGHKIISATKHGKVQLELEIVNIQWEPHQKKFGHEGCVWELVVELHLPKQRYFHIAHFQNWYDYICGTIDQETYAERDKAMHNKLRQ